VATPDDAPAGLRQRPQPGPDAELAALRQAHQDALAERAIAIQQVLETQREVARLFGELDRLDHATGPLGSRVRAAGVVFSAPVDHGPHRHIDAHLHGLRSPAQGPQQQLVRLVCHHGRAGLALFGHLGKTTPLRAWTPNIQEGHRSGLLLVPGDPQGDACLEQLGTSDWLTVLGLVQLLEGELARSAMAGATGWRVIASRLLMQLREVPLRLRFDSVQVELTAPAGAPLALVVHFAAPLHDSETFSTISLRWQPEARWHDDPAQAPLQWLLPAGAGEVPGLANWPVDALGLPLPWLALPVGPGLPAKAQRAAWDAFWPRERSLMLAVLDALPHCATAVETATLPAGWTADRLERAAVALGEDTRRQLEPRRWQRALWRRLGRA
jgi:hypothetical protein